MTNKIYRRLNRRLKQEQKNYEKRKKYCLKTYKDWVDNEYNYLDNKFIWAKVSEGQDQKLASFTSLNDAIVYYNRESHLYYFSCDLTIFDCGDRDSVQHMISYLTRIQDAFAAWFYEHNYNPNIVEPYCGIFELHAICAESMAMLKLQIDATISGLINTLKHTYNLS